MLPLTGDSPALFSGLQTDKSYRVTLYLWTSLGADINLGYNRVLMEEGRLMLPKQHPAKFLSAKYCEEADEDGKVKTFLRAAWDQMDDPRVASYDVIGADAGGNRLTLNDGPIYSTSWEASRSSLEAKGMAAGGPLSVEAALAGTTEVLSLGPIWQVEAVTCYGASNAQTTTTPPNGLVAFNLKVGSQKRVFLKWNAGTKWVRFKVYRANATCANADWATASLLSSTVTNRYYNDLDAPQTGTCAYRVVGVDSLGKPSTPCECAQVDMGTSGILQQPANLVARSDSPADTSRRQVNISWDPMQPDLQSAGFKFRIDLATKASDTTTTDCNLMSALYAKLDGQVGQAYKTHDFAVASPSANPLNSYRVAVVHPNIIDSSTNAPALLSPWSPCDMTHAAACTPGPQAVTINEGVYNPAVHSLAFTWAAASCSNPSYWVYKGIADYDGILVARVDTPSYTFTSGQLPQPGSNFTMTVVVVNKNTGCRSTPSGKSFFIPDTGCPAVPAPAAVSATVNATARTVSVAWAASNCGATGPCTYKILRRMAGCSATPVTICEACPASPFVDSAPPFNTPLYYSVIAIDSKSCRSPESLCSSAVTVPLPPAPTMTSISGQMNVINLSWSAVSGASYYIIYRGLGSCGSAQETDTAPYNYYQDAVTSSGATYYYKVAAVFDFQGAPSYTTPPSATCLSWAVPLLTSSYEANGAKPATRFYIHDHLGSTRLVLDSAGQIVSSHDFEPFGVEIPPYNDISGNTHKFTGYERDAVTGLDNAHARQMMPSLGRFASPDKIAVSKASMANPQLLNRYAYASNNPMAHIDLNGFWAQFILGTGQRSNMTSGLFFPTSSNSVGLMTARNALPQDINAGVTEGPIVWKPGSISNRAHQAAASANSTAALEDRTLEINGFSRGAISAIRTAAEVGRTVDLLTTVDPELRSFPKISPNVNIAVNISDQHTFLGAYQGPTYATADSNSTTMINLFAPDRNPATGEPIRHGNIDDYSAPLVADLNLAAENCTLTEGYIYERANFYGFTW